ncbi:MAG: polynucleotide adenylyltransferase PcnB [Gammaproteobacteria bacterium]
MISSWLKKVRKLTLRVRPQSHLAVSRHEPTILARKEHTLSRNDISDHALKVLYRLHKHGYQAFLVGGAVRDLLLGLHPKDFDVATDAKPEEVRALFRNCRLIGRRFRLAHVYFGPEIIEVATFRGTHSAEEINDSHSSEGMILRDNVYGTLEDDAWRRDFTVNALYYNIKDYSVVDFTGGLTDLKNRELRLIGSPEKRFREDPVRILRVIRFASKLNLNIARDLVDPIRAFKDLIPSVSTARLFEEVLKIFHSGAAVKGYELLKNYGIFEILFPYTSMTFEKKRFPFDKFLANVFESTDKRISADKGVTPAFLFAALFWYPICDKAEETILESAMPRHLARDQLMEPLFQEQLRVLGVPRRILQVVREILTLQMRMEKKPTRRVERILFEPRFRAAFDFLEMRKMAGEDLGNVVEWWQSYYEADTKSRKKMTRHLHGHRSKRPARSEK